MTESNKWTEENITKINKIVETNAHLFVEKSEDGCPCTLIEPCSDSCSCNNQFSSGGCERCCKYGSLEQRKAKANRIAKIHSIVAKLDSAIEDDSNNEVKEEYIPIFPKECPACKSSGEYLMWRDIRYYDRESPNWFMRLVFRKDYKAARLEATCDICRARCIVYNQHYNEIEKDNCDI